MCNNATPAIPASFAALVIGLGAIGMGYDLDSPEELVFTHVRALAHHPGFRLVGGVDPLPERQALFTATTGAPAWPTAAAAREALEGVDVVVIATSAEMRLELVRLALALSPKLVLLEKPLAYTEEEGATIVELCKEAGVTLAVNYFRRFDTALALAVDRNAAGRLASAVVRYSGGVLQNASHYLDLLLLWFGRPKGISLIGDDGPAGPEDRRLAFIVDHGTARTFFVPVRADYDFGEIDLLFQDGRLRFEDYCERVTLFRVGEDPLFPGYKRLAPDGKREFGYLRYQFLVADALHRFLTLGEPLPSTGDTALQTLALCAKLLHEAKRPAGRP